MLPKEKDDRDNSYQNIKAVDLKLNRFLTYFFLDLLNQFNRL